MSALVSSVQVIQAALKGLQCCLSGGKWKFGGGEELGSVLASLKVQNCNTFADFTIVSSFCPFIWHKHHTIVCIVVIIWRAVCVFCRGSCSRELQV